VQRMQVEGKNFCISAYKQVPSLSVEIESGNRIATSVSQRIYLSRPSLSFFLSPQHRLLTCSYHNIAFHPSQRLPASLKLSNIHRASLILSHSLRPIDHMMQYSNLLLIGLASLGSTVTTVTAIGKWYSLGFQILSPYYPMYT